MTRTRDLRFRKPSLYPSELQGHIAAEVIASTGISLQQPIITRVLLHSSGLRC